MFVVGDTGTVFRYDGRQWQQQPVPTKRDLRAVWGRGPTEVYVAGDSGTMLRYDGSTWHPVTLPTNNSPLYALIIRAGTTNVLAAGAGGRIIEARP